MSGTFPGITAPTQIELRSNQPTLISVAQSGRRYARDLGAQRWEISATWEMLDQEEGRALEAFIIAQRGDWDTFTFIPPHLATPRGVATGSPLVNGASQTGRSLLTKGWTISTTGIMKAGDIFKVAGHSKVYMMTADANSDGTGLATLSIEPALIASPADNEALTVVSVPFNVALSAGLQRFPVRAPFWRSYQAEFVEVY